MSVARKSFLSVPSLSTLDIKAQHMHIVWRDRHTYEFIHSFIQFIYAALMVLVVRKANRCFISGTRTHS